MQTAMEFSNLRSKILVIVIVALQAFVNIARADPLVAGLFVNYTGTPESQVYVPIGAGFVPPTGALTNIIHENGITFAVMTVAGAPLPSVGRIQIGAGIIQLPQTGSAIQNVVQGAVMVTVSYVDGTTITTPGTYLPPGTPNPPGAISGSFLTPSAGAAPILPVDAKALVAELIADPALELVSGFTPTLADFDFDFSGTTNFPAWSGPFTLHFADGTRTTLSIVPEPATLALLGVGLVGLAASRRKTA